MKTKYKSFSHKRLDPIIHNRLRLAILASAAHSDEVDFMSLKKSVQTTDGNLHIQLKKLEGAGLIIMNKSVQQARQQTNVALTNKGYTALTQYREIISGWLEI